MVSISCRTRLLLILIVCTLTRVAVGDVFREEVIVLKRIRGSPNLRVSGDGEGGGHGHGLLGVADQEVGPSRRSVEGASDRLESNKHPDLREAELATEAVTLKAAMTGSVENGTGVAPADHHHNNNNNNKNNNSTNAAPPVKTPPSPVPAPAKPKENTTAKLPPPANTTANSQSPSASTGDEVKAPPITHGGACDGHGPVIGKLAATGGEDGHHGYTLIVENVGKLKLDVTIETSSGWKATPGELALSKGQNKSVTVSVIDNEAAKHEAKITVSWSDGDCYVNVPPQNVVGDDVDRAASYLVFFNAPRTAALLLGGSLVFLLVLGVAGVWGCMSWRAHAQRHGDAETKYQELELTLPTTTDVKQDDGGGSPSADGWDEVWEDDDWHDTEAVRASSAALTLSSGGLNSRRANKDGWDSSWDD